MNTQNINNYISFIIRVSSLFLREGYNIMGIVKVSDELHEAARIMSKAMSRSINAQAEYWMQIGKLIEANPTITYPQVLNILVEQALVDDSVSRVSEMI